MSRLLSDADKDFILIQRQLFQCHREERSDVAIWLIHLERLPRPFRVRNDLVKIYIAFILVRELKIIPEKTSPLAISIYQGNSSVL